VADDELGDQGRAEADFGAGASTRPDFVLRQSWHNVQA
jgi:hypothetical protein